ncbi:response regulator [Leeuwenhoekiella sp. A16]|uniref:response regulator n=1 Tax=unclassified Leeuwenhoekiella TaxID=2615029 RepID=UPI003A7FAD4E|tara:strand:+ start:177146 stop:177781 length:636 start_codon:yes stop_codon:yes gene_type:complete
MTNLAIADHHPIIKEGLQHILNREDYTIVNLIVDGENLIEQLASEVPDLLILEIDLPNLLGLSAIKKIRREFPGIKILIFSTHPEEMYALSAIKSGAMGYVGKSSDIEVIVKAIEQVCKGGIYINNDLTQMLSNTHTSTSNLAYKYKKLSSREIEVLNLLSSGKRNKDIAETLKINEKTVSTYKTRLLKKLDASSLAELIQQARLLQTSDL